MPVSDHPDRVLRHEPARCTGCGRGLAGAREAGVIRRQVTEIPPVKAEVTEHQMIGRACGCGTVTWGQAPKGVTAPVQYGPRVAALAAYLWHGPVLARDRAAAARGEMFGCAPSPGALAAMTAKIAGIIAPAIDAIVKALIAADVAHFDETGFRVAGKLAWAHSASSGKFVLVTVHAKRGTAGMDAAGVLPSFAGIACHVGRLGAVRQLRRRGRARPVRCPPAPGADRRHRDRHRPDQRRNRREPRTSA